MAWDLVWINQSFRRKGRDEQIAKVQIRDRILRNIQDTKIS